MTLDELKESIIDELTIELQGDSTFSSQILSVKVANAIREVKKARHYSNNHTEDMIAKDMENYYSNIRNIALYDYNQIGAEFESSHTGNGVTRSYTDRDSLFSGIIPMGTTS